MGLLISIGALYLALRDVHWREVGTAVTEANYLLIALAAVLLCGSLALRALRWRVLFYPQRGLNITYLFGCLNVAYLINNVVPLQLGDLGRAYLLGELEDISTTRSLATIVVERILDILTLLVFLAVLIPFVDMPGWVRTPSIILAAAVASGAAIMILASQRRALTMRFVNRALRIAPERFRPKLNEMVHSALDGFSVLANPRVGLELAIWSVVTWLAVGLVVYTGMQAFNLDLGFGAALFVLIATTFGFFVPSSPGAFGVYHAIVIKVLTSVFGVDRNAAVSYALVVHLVFYLPPMFLGLGFLWKERRLWQRTSFMDKLRSLQGERPAGEGSAAST